MAPLLAAVGGLLFPPVCLFCHAPVAEGDRVCADCLPSIRPLRQDRLCPRCALPLPEDAPAGPCGGCLRRPPHHRQAMALFAYRGAVRAALLRWKLQGEEGAVDWLLDAAAASLRARIAPTDLLLPIPMPLDRMRRSGRHHAADLCRAIAARTGCRWSWRWLRRQGRQPRQSALDRQARLLGPRRAFTLDARHAPELAEGASVWLVDDIMTTGATLDAAARLLCRAGVVPAALALARTLPRRQLGLAS